MSIDPHSVLHKKNKERIVKSLFVVCSLLYSYCSFSQAYFLKVDRLKKGEIVKTKTYYEGHWVKLKTINGSKLKGNYFIYDENTIIVNDQKVALNDILRIRFDNRHLFSGTLLTILGPPTFLIGLTATALEDSFSREDNNSNAEIATALGLGALVGGIVILSNKNKRPLKKKWKVSILVQ